MSRKIARCLDCGESIYEGSIRCNSCAAKDRKKRGCGGHQWVKGQKCVGGFQKGHKTNIGKACEKSTKVKIGAANAISQLGNKNGAGNIGKVTSEKVKEKQRNSKDGHHIWYEDNEGNSTDKGIWFVSKKRHQQIHAVLRHNHWIDNRRYLAG